MDIQKIIAAIEQSGLEFEKKHIFSSIDGSIERTEYKIIAREEILGIKLDTKERSEVPSEDFVIHDKDGGKFPITKNPSSISDAVSSWGRYKGPTSFETFKKNLIKIAKRKGWTEYLPKSWNIE